MNPELQRQLWLNFSLTRWLVMPALLITAAMTIALNSGEPAHDLSIASAVAFVLLVGVMGAHAVGNSVQDEVNEDTWDHQRMSAMQPWSMTWGKLVGASAYAWYGGTLCLLIAIPSALAAQHALPVTTGSAVAIGVLVCLLLQASLLAINLQFLQLGTRLPKRSNALLLVPLLFVALNLAFNVPAQMLTDGSDFVHWWGMPFSDLLFFLVSLLGFLACALVAAWRAMGQVLAVRQLPWGLPLLSLLLTGYCAGFAGDGGAAQLGWMGMAICLAMTYAALLSESQSRPVWQRVAERAGRGRWREALQLMPAWPTVWILSLPFAWLLSAHVDTVANPNGPQSIHFPPLSWVLLVFRDACIALFFAFARNTRRSGLAFLLTMGLLYGLLPWFSTAATPVVQTLLLPLLANETSFWSLSLLMAVVHALVAMAVLRWQWRRAPTMFAAPQPSRASLADAVAR